jgi:hypothetical protein
MTRVRSWHRDATLIKQAGASSATCEWCGRTFLAADLTWVCEDWETIGGRRGHTTATLCSACGELALSHCWRCGQLMGSAPDDLCASCRAEVEP